jgi:hypothetical protein
MEGLLKLLFDPTWIISVVVVSFIINLGSAYAKPLIDRGVSRVWNARKIAIEREDAELARQASIIAQSPIALTFVKLDVIHYYLRFIFATMFSMLLMIMIVVLNRTMEGNSYYGLVIGFFVAIAVASSMIAVGWNRQYEKNLKLIGLLPAALEKDLKESKSAEQA